MKKIIYSLFIISICTNIYFLSLPLNNSNKLTMGVYSANSNLYQNTLSVLASNKVIIFKDGLVHIKGDLVEIEQFESSKKSRLYEIKSSEKEIIFEVENNSFSLPIYDLDNFGIITTAIFHKGGNIPLTDLLLH